MIIEDTDKKYSRIYFPSLAVAVSLVVIIFSCSSCKFLSKVSKSTKDSTSVNNIKEGSARFDSSGSKSDVTNIKETVYYPQPIIVPGKDGETKVIFVPQTVKETDNEKKEQAHVTSDTSWREAIREITIALSNKDKTSSAKTDWLTIAILIGIGLLVLKSYLPFSISLRK